MSGGAWGSALREAVVVDLRPEGIFVVIISTFATWPIGGIDWANET